MPTIAGWLFLIIICTVTFMLLAINLYSFLAPNEPVSAHILVVEGWLSPEELDQAAQSFKKGKYERIITTGGPISGWQEMFLDADYATFAADFLSKRGIKRDQITPVTAPWSAQDRTFLSAVMLRRYLQDSEIKIDAIDVFSSGPHARRSRLLFQMALGNKIGVGILAAKPNGYDPDAWWRTSMGVETMVFQSLGLVWVKCCFWPGSRGSKNELWG